MYKLTGNEKPIDEQTIVRLSDGASIPHTDKNHYPVYLDWRSAGNAPEPADAPPVTYSITPRMTLEVLSARIDALEAIIEKLK